MTLFFMVGFTMCILEDCGAKLLAVLVLDWSDLLQWKTAVVQEVEQVVQ